MPLPTHDQVVDAHNKLRDFLNFVYNLLRDIARRGRNPRDQPLFLEEIRPLIEDAWVEFETDFDLDESFGRIERLEPSDLRSHGLYGKQLELKLRVVDVQNALFQKFGGGKLFKTLIKAIDTLLESLFGATGIDGAMKEIKDVLGDSVAED
ncbi:MAG: hypothetical protein QOK24_2683 [Verrucomicrobiota bacterium]|jgi:hypothetical protein